jgi:acetylornithine/succinyldiaminopimelate/putrescine aminotransferase
VLETLDRDGLLENAAAMGRHLVQGLDALAAKHPTLCEPSRGVGLLCGLPLKDGVDPRAVLNEMRARGVLIVTAGERVLRFAPPLIVTREQLDEGLRALDEVLTAHAAEGGR